jgi:DNA-binding NarL/FixJ family response regulator
MLAWVIEDQREVREGVASVIERRVAAAQVTGMFAEGRAALRAVARGEPFDVALVDLGLPDMRGADLIRQLRCQRGDSAIVAFTVRFDDEALFSALRAGASGYITKDASDECIVHAVQSAASGAAPFSPDIGRRVAASFWSTPSNTEASDPKPTAAVLTPRERQVLDLIGTGASYREIGVALGISLGTVQTHIKSVYGKLGVGTKVEAIWSSRGASAPSR